MSDLKVRPPKEDELGTPEVGVADDSYSRWARLNCWGARCERVVRVEVQRGAS
jgi:hypothetical protein